GSRAVFLASSLPYAAYLLALPVAEILAGVAQGTQSVVIFGALLLIGYTYTAWLAHDRTLRAEARARAELETRRREAEAAVAARSQFVAMVSHELRTPLSGVLAAGEALQGRLEKAANREAAAVLVDAGRFMTTLLNDLLDFAKLDAGKMTTEVVEFDLGQLLWALQRHWGLAAAAEGKSVQLVSASGLPVLAAGDPTRIRQILNNLLSNAVKFTGPTGVSWTVDVATGPSCATLGSLGLTVRVTDTGPGISSEQLERLFTAFDQTSETVARTHGGTGLGLALSRELARRMGGELSVETQVGLGSTFVLHLPLACADVRQPAEAAGAKTGCSPLGRPLRVLVVDDHPINRRTLGVLLEPSGAEVTAVESSAEALDRLGAETFDVVLTDLNMPGMNGLALARAIRARTGPNAGVPLVAVTGADSAEERAACSAAGMNGYVTKPIDVAALYAALAEAVSPDPEAEAGAPRAA
ncbi:MAG: response regulator, partial [Proteobacteria bacterium]|nr:response regulator [Pseudomonadota bacterium]